MAGMIKAKFSQCDGDVWGSGSIASGILNLSNRRKLVVSFMVKPLYTRKIKPLPAGQGEHRMLCEREKYLRFA
jgi:hypothetical protein